MKSDAVEEVGEVRMASSIDQAILQQGVCPMCRSHRVGRLTMHLGRQHERILGWYCRDCMVEWAIADEKERSQR